MIISRLIFVRMRNVSGKVVKKIKSQISCFMQFFRKSCRLWYNVEKYGRTGQATDDIIRRLACWISKDKNANHNLSYLMFSTATMIERSGTNIVFTLLCLFCCKYLYCEQCPLKLLDTRSISFIQRRLEICLSDRKHVVARGLSVVVYSSHYAVFPA
jgi:hypothetical protein